MFNVIPTDLGQAIRNSLTQYSSWATKLVNKFIVLCFIQGLLRCSRLPLFQRSSDSKSDKSSHMLVFCVFYIHFNNILRTTNLCRKKPLTGPTPVCRAKFFLYISRVPYVLHAAAHLPHDVSYCVNNKYRGVSHCTVSPTLSRYAPQLFVYKHITSQKYSSNILLLEPQTQILRPASEGSEVGVFQ